MSRLDPFPLYINGKWIPQFAGAYLFNNESTLIIPSLAYLMSNTWHFTIEAGFLGGDDPKVPLWLFRKNDYITYKGKNNVG